MSTEQFLIFANAAVWLGLGGYVAFLAAKLAGLETRLRRLSALSGGEGEG